MHQLLLLRHARSSPDDGILPDRERPLDQRGRRDIAAMRYGMRQLGLAPDLILVSSATRTRQSLSALEPWDDTPLIETLDELYLANEAKLLAVLHGVTDTVKSVLLIGHNPGMHELALALTDPHTVAPDPWATMREGFPTAALAEFSVNGPWSRLRAGRAILRRFITPKMLKTLD